QCAAGDRESLAIRADCSSRIALPFRAARERRRSGGSCRQMPALSRGDVMNVDDPAKLNDHYNDLFRAADVGGLLNLYETDAILCPKPGVTLCNLRTENADHALQPARGRNARR